MSRVFLYVHTVDGHNSIALDNLTDDERRLVDRIAEGLKSASCTFSLRPIADVLDTDPDADERTPAPSRSGWSAGCALRPLVVVTGTLASGTES